MISVYPKNGKIKGDLKHFFSSSCGISEPYIRFLPIGSQYPKMQITQSEFPGIAKLVFHEAASMNYHITGYGVSDDESMIRLLGETIERYAFVTSKCTLHHDIINTSYATLKQEGYTVLPLEYVNVISDNSRKRMQSYGLSSSLYMHYTEDQIIDWIPMNSLFDHDLKVYIPKDMVCPDIVSGYQAMSTGTATHGTYRKALCNALIEHLQLHTFMKFWYTDSQGDRIILSDSLLQKVLDTTIYQQGKTFDIIVLDITDHILNLPTFLAIIMNRKKTDFPLCSFGIQSGYDIEDVIFRAIMEASAIYNSLPFMYLLTPDMFRVTLEKMGQSINLDDNFCWWGSSYDLEKKLDYIDSIQRKEPVHLSLIRDKYDHMQDYGLEEIINIVQLVSSFACFRDISFSEGAQRAYYTMRTVIPECLPMCLPSYPFDNHPILRDSIIKKGGLDEYFPHPLP